VSKLPPAWHNDVRRLRAGGMHITEISRRVGHGVDMVKWVLDEKGERDRARERVRRCRGTIATAAHRLIEAPLKREPPVLWRRRHKRSAGRNPRLREGTVS